MVLVFVVVFYAMTFAVYYFYSPGPEERNQTAMDAQLLQEKAVTTGEQKAQVTVTVDESMTQQSTQEAAGTQETQMGTQEAPSDV